MIYLFTCLSAEILSVSYMHHIKFKFNHLRRTVIQMGGNFIFKYTNLNLSLNISSIIKLLQFICCFQNNLF